MRIHWNPQAKTNLRSIKTYYEDEAVEPVISNVIRGIFSAVDRLKRHPHSGRVVPEINDSKFREVIWKKWRIIYTVSDQSEQIEILNVLHTAQQLGSR